MLCSGWPWLPCCTPQSPCEWHHPDNGWWFQWAIQWGLVKIMKLCNYRKIEICHDLTDDIITKSWKIFNFESKIKHTHTFEESITLMFPNAEHTTCDVHPFSSSKSLTEKLRPEALKSWPLHSLGSSGSIFRTGQTPFPLSGTSKVSRNTVKEGNPWETCWGHTWISRNWSQVVVLFCE